MNQKLNNTPRKTMLNLAIRLLPALLIVISAACNLPSIFKPSPQETSQPQPKESQQIVPIGSPTPLPTPTATPQPLPPAIVETKPEAGSVIPLQGKLTFYFNQPMERASVEESLSGEPMLSGEFNWLDDATLVFEPNRSYPQDTVLTVNFNTNARAANGLALLSPQKLQFRTASPLKITNILPKRGLKDVDPYSAVVVNFNQPIVPLGGDPASLPAALIIEPQAQGEGEWVNTSTYVFYPDPPLYGGTPYRVRINPDLTSTVGASLEESISWSFTTAKPQLLNISPEESDQTIRLDTTFKLEFSQPMDETSVENNFSLLTTTNESISGAFGWNEDFTTLTFTPTNILERDTDYILVLQGNAQAQGGTPLGFYTSIRYHSVLPLNVVHTDPPAGGTTGYSGVSLYFTAPLEWDQDFLKFITITPAVTNLRHYYSDYERSLRIFGDFQASTTYTLQLAPGLKDPWGESLSKPFTLNFHTKPLRPELFINYGLDAIFVTPQETAIPAQATNLSQINLSLGSVPFADLVRFYKEGGYDFRKNYAPADAQYWKVDLDLEPDRSQAINLPILPSGNSLSPGIYNLNLTVPSIKYEPGPFLIVSSNVHLTYKLSNTEVFVWAIDLRTYQAVQNTPITVYNNQGVILASGTTDSQGIFEAAISSKNLGSIYDISYAMLAQPGDDLFSLSLSNWMQGLAPYEFGIPSDTRPPQLQTYIYTDRPIYRPGQTVFFRAIARQAYNSRYDLPNKNELSMVIYDNNYQEIKTLELPLSPFGTAHGQWEIPKDAQPGNYQFAIGDDRVVFRVSEYRKPEINLTVGLTPSPILLGNSLNGKVNARYFFDAPAENVSLKWTLSVEPGYFYLPGYNIGNINDHWLLPELWNLYGQLGTQLASGKGKTGHDGTLNIDFSPEDLVSDYCAYPCNYTLEVTLTDESGFPVSARAEATVHPADFYIGVHPDMWVGHAGAEMGFDVFVVDWDKNPFGEQNLRAELQKVRWVRHDSQYQYDMPTYEKETETISSANFCTASDGHARVAFTPPEPGVYQLEVTGEGASTQVLIWVGGAGQAIWPALPNQRVQLTADRDTVKPGENVQIFIPNPLGKETQALLTVERSEILRHQLFVLDEGGTSISLPITEEDIPNIFVAVTLIGQNTDGYPDFRQGFLEINVEPDKYKLNLTLLSEPERTGPRGEVTFDIRVTDAENNPVTGEFSLSVVDQAVLALADPNSPDILSAFYGKHGLGVRTSLTLAVSSKRRLFVLGGLGGGGGADEEGRLSIIREKFPDTAYWNTEIITDEDGKATVTVTLPDNLTTWSVDVRGLTMDTHVGEAHTQVIATKDLLVRPVTPRFLVVGDHSKLAAVVHNNTERDLQVAVSLEAKGFTLDNPTSEVQNVTIPANSRMRVEWWGVAENSDNVDLVFTAQSGDLIDVTRPVWGALPVLKDTAPQTFGTSGILAESGDRLELVSLPRTFDPSNGHLDVKLSPSLASVIISALDILEHTPYEYTEQTLSRFLSNLEAYQALQELGLDSPDLQERLERTLDIGLQRLLAEQNDDGGWGWWKGGESEPHITAYILFGLARAHQANVLIDYTAIQNAINYLIATLPAPAMLSEPWQFDRLSFANFALAEAGSGSRAIASALYKSRNRLSPWAQAMLALTLESFSPGDNRVDILLSDLESTAIRSSTGTHWENKNPSHINMSTPNFNNAVVIYALAQLDSASATLPNAVQALISSQAPQGGWFSTYESAWSILALTKYMQITGELSADFDFSALLNGSQIAEGSAQENVYLAPTTASIPISDLYSNYPNALIIRHGSGSGLLYYTAHLNVSRPVEDIAPLNKGISVRRQYLSTEKPCSQDECPAIVAGKTGDVIKVKVSLTLENNAYYFMIEDYFPAGAEIIDFSLKTSQQSLDTYDPHNPFADGWGWWYFAAPQIYSDHIAWAASYLPMGTYELTYLITLNQPGEYHVLPSRAWEFYFPEVQGNSAGEIFTILE